ncbi:hypothetical protein ColTof4_14139 [Colletotrichum tofieldiae]|nr:hypothetical protein ColTof3_02942 [Colletotrichum tofieldiae]GKT81716.1 hypothetical protein ColTof4_14139 [Colletotrichum tofieldiae]
MSDRTMPRRVLNFLLIPLGLLDLDVPSSRPRKDRPSSALASSRSFPRSPFVLPLFVRFWGSTIKWETRSTAIRWYMYPVALRRTLPAPPHGVLDQSRTGAEAPPGQCRRAGAPDQPETRDFRRSRRDGGENRCGDADRGTDVRRGVVGDAFGDEPAHCDNEGPGSARDAADDEGQGQLGQKCRHKFD